MDRSVDFPFNISEIEQSILAIITQNPTLELELGLPRRHALFTYPLGGGVPLELATAHSTRSYCHQANPNREDQETELAPERTLYAGASPLMMRQNTQPAESPSPPPSPPVAAPPPLAHVDVETADATAASDCSPADGAGPSGRRWEQSTARRRGGDISGAGRFWERGVGPSRVASGSGPWASPSFANAH
jgi:hypothetical protein